MFDGNEYILFTANVKLRDAKRQQFARRSGRMRPSRAFFAGLLVASISLLEYPGFFASLVLAIGFFAVVLAAGNAVGGYVATVRMLEMFKSSKEGK